MHKILVLYYSRHGATRLLANKIAQGIEQGGCEAVLRTVPSVSAGFDETPAQVPDDGDPYVQKRDLTECAALAMGSPTRFGNMASAMKYFWDGTVEQWIAGELVGKPACVFTSTGSMHGGQESTLLTMMVPLLHHGMIIAGLPYTEPQLQQTQSGGTPYGASHVQRHGEPVKLTDDESQLAVAQGQRLAQLAFKLG